MSRKEGRDTGEICWKEKARDEIKIKSVGLIQQNGRRYRMEMDRRQTDDILWRPDITTTFNTVLYNSTVEFLSLIGQQVSVLFL